MATIEESPSSTQPMLAEVDTDVRDEGFSVLWNCLEPKADIVLIHGLQGHPAKTWCHGPYSGPTPSRSAPPRILRRSDKERTGCFWPRDILPRHFPACRILTYGYDSHISHFFTGSSNQTNIGGHARSLLNDLEALRQGEPSRPVIFIAHSLGGLLLKEALRQAWQSDEDEDAGIHNIYESTIATIFLGTPHRGSDLAEWGIMVQRAVRAVRFDTSDVLLRDLRVESTMLETINDSFAKIRDRRRFQIFSFREGQALSVLFFWREKVVKDASAILGYPGEISDTINSDHRRMCQFTGENDPGYLKIKDSLNKALNSLPWGVDSPEFRDILGQLDSVETRWRAQQVEPAFKDTFEWLFSDSSLGFLRWLESDSGLYWIKGKPASGKSTLLKMAYTDARTKVSQSELKKRGFRCTTAAFFFHDRGSPLQKSLEGLLKAILHRVLSDVPELKPIVHEAWSGLSVPKSHSFTWTADSLMIVLERIIEQNVVDMSVLLFVDALDEYDGRYQDIVQFLNLVFHASTRTKRTKVKICATSRPEQVFLDNLSDAPGFSIHDHTSSDIEKVVDIEFEANARLRRCLQSGPEDQKMAIQGLRAKIILLAEGVFLWVRLILDELLTEFTDGASLDDISDQLQNLPTDLIPYYSYLLEKRIRQKYIDETRIMFALAKCAVRPLALSDFLLAFRLATQKDLNIRSIRFTSLDEAKRLIGSRCGGLVQLRQFRPTNKQTYAPGHLMFDVDGDNEEMGCIYNKPSLINRDLESYQVQFLHQTVKTFAMTSETTTLKPKDAQESGHLYLVKLYLLVIRDSAFMENGFVFQKDFARYLRLAEDSSMRSLSPYLGLVEASKIVSAMNAGPGIIREKGLNRHLLPPLSDYSELAVLGLLPRLLAERLETESDERASHLFALFCQYLGCAWIGFPSHIGQLLLKHDVDECVIWRGVTGFFQASLQRSFDKRRLELMQLVLDNGVDPNTPFTVKPESTTQGNWTRILHIAVQYGAGEVVKLLLQKGANPNALDGADRSPLELATAEYLHYFGYIVKENNNSTLGGEDKYKLEKYTTYFSMAKQMLERGAYFPDAFPVECTWKIGPEAQQMIRSLGIPTDARLPYPSNLGAEKQMIEAVAIDLD